MTSLTLRKLSKEYGTGEQQAERRALSGLDLCVQDGELLVLLGPSGAGKTTALRLIAGLERPTSGDILFDSKSVLSLAPEKREAVMVFQQHALFPFMSVADNVAFGLKMRKTPAGETRSRVAEALEAVQLAGFESRWPEQLSGGQAQRVALARALVVRPRLLLLDEPFSNLDRTLRQELRQMVCTLQRETGVTTIFVTHNQAEAVAIADRIAVIMDGRLRQIGEPRAFFEQPVDAEIARFFGADNFLPGIKKGAIVETAIGAVEIPSTSLANGPVLLSVRPEAIEIGANGHNNYPARVDTWDYQAPYARCRVRVGNVHMNVFLPPYLELGKNQAICVHLPRERIRVLRASAASLTEFLQNSPATLSR